LLPELHLRRLRHPWKGCVSYVGAALKVRNGSDCRQLEILKVRVVSPADGTYPAISEVFEVYLYGRLVVIEH
jgi:hypothetical protein